MAQVMPVQFQEVTSQVIGAFPLCQDLTVASHGGDWCFIAVGDWNGDGWDDLLLNTHPGIHWMVNNRNGTFTEIHAPLPPVVTGVTDHRHVLTWCDFNADGREDLIIGTGFVSETRVNMWMRNNGDGTFTDLAANLGVQDAGSNDWAQTCVDIDKNGYSDVLFLRNDMPLEDGVYPPSHRLWMNYGGMAFTESSEVWWLTGDAHAIAPYAVMFTDLNGDGYPDGVEIGNNVNHWLLATGLGNYYATTGVYEPMADLSPYLHDANFSDFNRDGLQDAAIVDTFVSGTQPILHIHCNNGHFVARTISADGLRECWRSSVITGAKGVGEGQSLAVGDFDNSGNQSLFLTTRGGQVISGTTTDTQDYFWLNHAMGVAERRLLTTIWTGGLILSSVTTPCTCLDHSESTAM
jgi:hypothetical protein